MTARMRRLAEAFAVRLCDKYHNLMSWLFYQTRSKQTPSVLIILNFSLYLLYEFCSSNISEFCFWNVLIGFRCFPLMSWLVLGVFIIVHLPHHRICHKAMPNNVHAIISYGTTLWFLWGGREEISEKNPGPKFIGKKNGDKDKCYYNTLC